MSRTARPEAYSAVQRAVGTRMVWVREALDISLTEAARLMGVHISTLAKIESGDRAASIFNVIEFSVRFRVSADFLLRGVLVGRTDEELALVLAARHPELVLQPGDIASGKPDTKSEGSKFRPPKRQANG